MLVTAQTIRRNQYLAVAVATATVIAFAVLGWFCPWCWLGVVLGPLAHWWMRRGCKRRVQVMAQPFPQVWEGVLRSRVAYFNALNEEQKKRFRQLTKIFLDETRITGIRTDVDETTRVLVAASAIIPVFKFDHWEYSRLGEVLIYPGSFDANFQTDQDGHPAQHEQYDEHGLVESLASFLGHGSGGSFGQGSQCVRARARRSCGVGRARSTSGRTCRANSSAARSVRST